MMSSELVHLAHVDTRPDYGFCWDCLPRQGHNVWPVHCDGCNAMMISTYTGFQCPQCDAHDICSSEICGYDTCCRGEYNLSDPHASCTGRA